jgi:hypothetical protein
VENRADQRTERTGRNGAAAGQQGSAVRTVLPREKNRAEKAKAPINGNAVHLGDRHFSLLGLWTVCKAVNVLGDVAEPTFHYDRCNTDDRI